MQNTDKIIDYILKNTKELSAAKIKALAEVVRALGGEVTKEPNSLPIENDPGLFQEDNEPLDLSSVQAIEMDGTKRPIKVFSN
jgi:hypothetical protein